VHPFCNLQSHQIKSNLTKLDLYIVIPNKTKKSNNIKYMHTSLSNLGPLRSIILDDKKLLTQLDRYKETKYIIDYLFFSLKYGDREKIHNLDPLPSTQS
jgi:transposase